MSCPHLRIYGVLRPRSAPSLQLNRGYPAVVAEQIEAGLDAVSLRQSRPIALMDVSRRKPVLEIAALDLGEY